MARGASTHLKRTQEKKRITELLNRFHKQALGKLDPPMTHMELRAGEVWLKKHAPDLASQQVAVEVDGEITIKWK